MNVNPLPEHQKKPFTGPKGSTRKEWAEICTAGPDGAKAVKIHRGASAAENYRKYPRRIVPFRWHHRWTDKGVEYNNGLNDSSVPKNYDATSRSFIRGFHDPDVAALSRTVPTPSTYNVPLALQCASHKDSVIHANNHFCFTAGRRRPRREPR